MFQKVKTFWNAFWSAIKTAYNRAFKDIPNEPTQKYRDTKHINFLAIFVSKLNNLANIESTYSVESDSNQAEVLKELCEEIESKRFDITEAMLGDGDMWVFPSTDSNGKLYHRYVTQDRVRVLAMDGDSITDVIGIVDESVDEKNQIYFLNRRHTLNGDTLLVETYITNERNERVPFAEWADEEALYQFQGAEHIGVGRFKSPVSSRGLSPIYGVPLNFGCEEIEAKIFNDMDITETEFERAESKLFADANLLRKRRSPKDGVEEYNIPEGVFPIEKRAGDTGSLIDIFSPAIRYGEYRSKLLDDFMQYEQQVGVDRGFLTPFESGTAATATEIRRANASTIALIDKIHTAIKVGVESVIRADAVFLNIASDLYSLKFDFFDAFEDADKQYERIANARDRGTAEDADEMKWLFPNLTDEEIEEKLARIASNKQVKTEDALDKILQGQ